MSEGSFEIMEKQLGKGAFGIVYLGYDIYKQKYVALKQVPQEIINDNQKLEALSNEILISSGVSGDNLVKIMDITDLPPRKFLVYEYCNGGDLRRYLNFFGKFDENLVQICVRQILSGLNELHKKKIIHHDVKPENVLVVFGEGYNGDIRKLDEFADKVKGYTEKPRKGKMVGDISPFILQNLPSSIDDRTVERLLRSANIKLSDFGLSKFGEEQNEKMLSGSPLYMAPEMFESGAKIENIENTKVDVWALGILAYELYFGKRPFDSKNGTLKGLIESLQIGKFDINLDECYSISIPFLGFLNLCLQSDPNDRPSVSELLLSEFITADYKNFNIIKKDNFSEYCFYMNKNFPHKYKENNINKIFMHSKDKKFLATVLGV